MHSFDSLVSRKRMKEKVRSLLKGFYAIVSAPQASIANTFTVDSKELKRFTNNLWDF